MRGQHRASWGEVRIRNRADRMRRHETPWSVRVLVWWAAVTDWGRVARTNFWVGLIEVRYDLTGRQRGAL
jgi:hypothetical protein